MSATPQDPFQPPEPPTRGSFRLSRRWIAIAVCVGLIAAGLILALGGGGAPAGSVAANGAASFLGRASNAVAFIEWTRSGNTVTGSMQEAILKQPAGTGLSTSETPFSGTISGNGITLQLKRGLLESPTALSGQVHEPGFTLNLPGRHVPLFEVGFVPARLAQFNEAVRQLELSQYGSPCTLHLQGHDAEVTIDGPDAPSECASFVASAPSEEIWTTEEPSSPPYANSTVCELESGRDTVIVEDSGGQLYGGEACDHFLREGWTPTEQELERRRQAHREEEAQRHRSERERAREEQLERQQQKKETEEQQEEERHWEAEERRNQAEEQREQRQEQEEQEAEERQQQQEEREFEAEERSEG